MTEWVFIYASTGERKISLIVLLALEFMRGHLNSPKQSKDHGNHEATRMLMALSTQAHFLTLFHFSVQIKFSLHASELHKTKLQPLSALLFSSFLSEQSIDMAVVQELQGHLLLINYNRSQHITQWALLLVMLISRTDPLGYGEKMQTPLNKLKELKLEKTGNSISTLSHGMTLKQFGLDVIHLLEIKHLLEGAVQRKT